MWQIFATIRKLLLDGIKWIFVPLHCLLYVLGLRIYPGYDVRVAQRDQLAAVLQENLQLKNEIRQLMSQYVTREEEMKARIDELEEILNGRMKKKE
mmetsp:Transcript_137/g.256  ORF Transcript_137/g.256 Transcript_137/m.256 type:complete len:96 (+) Transcript_137:152-439(+)|eukprot:CAMPEP_0196822914 /NCGR_PEP_ID=MMETSP1362-20130617/85314_1 /TAXON_ID=163516 /ORGANISM="Leptocylindrus danicus, Strain CCMP1856" /LENGTH=95 /DNA_ID=CAMNT_0042202605 /DNA_START=35 /DNA_END=322 /DNA_ORIENTATION=+